MTEKRMHVERAPRYATDLCATVGIPENPGERAARIHNLSAGGLLLSGTSAPPPGATVAVEIPDDYGVGRVVALGHIAWREDDRAGVQLEAMLPHHRQRFHKLLEALAHAADREATQ